MGKDQKENLGTSQPNTAFQNSNPPTETNLLARLAAAAAPALVNANQEKDEKASGKTKADGDYEMDGGGGGDASEDDDTAAAVPDEDETDSTAASASASASADEDGDHEMNGGGGGDASEDDDTETAAVPDEDDIDRAASATDRNADANHSDSDADGSNTATMDIDDADIDPKESSAKKIKMNINGDGASALKEHLTDKDINELHTYAKKYKNLGCFVLSTDGKACYALSASSSDTFIKAINLHIKSEKKLPQTLNFSVFNAYLNEAPKRRKLIQVKGTEKEIQTFIEWINNHRQGFQKRETVGKFKTEVVGQYSGVGFELVSSRIANEQGCDIKTADAKATQFITQLRTAFKEYESKTPKSRTELNKAQQLLKLARFQQDPSTGIFYSWISSAFQGEKQKKYFDPLRKILRNLKDCPIDFKKVDFSRSLLIKTNTSDDAKAPLSNLVYLTETGTQFPISQESANTLNQWIKENVEKGKAAGTSDSKKQASGGFKGAAYEYIKNQLEQKNSPQKRSAKAILKELIDALKTRKKGSADGIHFIPELNNCACVLTGSKKQLPETLSIILRGLETTHKKYFEFDEAKFFQDADGKEYYLVCFKRTELAKKEKKTLEWVAREFDTHKSEWQKHAFLKRNRQKSKASDESNSDSEDAPRKSVKRESSASAGAAARSSKPKPAPAADSKAAKPKPNAEEAARKSAEAATEATLKSKAEAAARKTAIVLAKIEPKNLNDQKSISIDGQSVQDSTILAHYNRIFREVHQAERNKLISDAKKAGTEAGRLAALAGKPLPNKVDPEITALKTKYDPATLEHYYIEYCLAHKMAKPATGNYQHLIEQLATGSAAPPAQQASQPPAQQSQAGLLSRFGQFAAPSSAAAAPALLPAAKPNPPKSDEPQRMDLS